MLKGLVMNQKKEQEVEEVHEGREEQKQKKALSLRPEEGSLTAHWMIKNRNVES